MSFRTVIVMFLCFVEGHAGIITDLDAQRFLIRFSLSGHTRVMMDTTQRLYSIFVLCYNTNIIFLQSKFVSLHNDLEYSRS